MSSASFSIAAAGRGLLLLLLAVPLAAAARETRAAAGEAATGADPVAASGDPLRLAEERFGVKILSVRTSAEGHVVDLRYRVLDAGKAAPLFARGIHPSLYDEGTGQVLSVPSAPKTGPLRASGRPMEHRTYFILFGNPGGLVRCGSRVTLLLGDLEARGLVVD